MKDAPPPRKSIEEILEKTQRLVDAMKESRQLCKELRDLLAERKANLVGHPGVTMRLTELP